MQKRARLSPTPFGVIYSACARTTQSHDIAYASRSRRLAAVTDLCKLEFGSRMDHELKPSAVRLNADLTKPRYDQNTFWGMYANVVVQLASRYISNTVYGP